MLRSRVKNAERQQLIAFGGTTYAKVISVTFFVDCLQARVPLNLVIIIINIYYVLDNIYK